MDKRKRRWREGGRGGWGTIIRGRRSFKIFLSKGGDSSREAINRGTAVIRGNTVSLIMMMMMMMVMIKIVTEARGNSFIIKSY